MTTNEMITLGVSVISVVIAVTSLIRSRILAAKQLSLSEEQVRLSEKQLQLDRITATLASKQIDRLEIEEREKLQPKLRVNLTKIAKSWYFLVANQGEGSACNLNFTLVGCGDSPLTTRDQFPVSELRSQDRVKVLAAFHIGSTRKYHVHLTWDDSDGNNYTDDFHLFR